MEGVRRRVFGGAYVEERRHSRLDSEEDINMAAVGTHRGRQREPRSNLRPGFMVSKAADPAVL